MSAHDDFLAVQAAAAALVQADPFFTGLEVLTEAKGDLNQLIRASLQKIGLCVVVMTPDFEITKRVRQRKRVRVRVVVECSEISIVNKTGKAPLAAAWAAAVALDCQPNGLDPEGAPHMAGIREFTLHDSQPVVLVPDKQLLTYHTIAHTEVSL